MVTKKLGTATVHIVDLPEQTGPVAAAVVLEQLKEKPNAVFCLTGGKSPVPMFNYLIKDHKDHGTNYSRATVAALDEWTDPAHPWSIRSIMERDFNGHVNFGRKLYVDGPPFAPDTGTKYERAIEKAGGIDLLVLGIGVNGHVGSNEPGSRFDSETRTVDILPATSQRYEKEFGGRDKVPKVAMTIGLSNMRHARRVLMIAFGYDKAEAIRQMLVEPPSEDWPASCLQGHPHLVVVLDKEAASRL